MDTRYEPSRLIGPEDIRVGEYVTVSHVVYEWVSRDEHQTLHRPIEPTRVTMMADDAGRPLRVVGVCQPFVLVEDPRGKHTTVDLRQHRLAKLSRDFGTHAFCRMRPSKGSPDVLCTDGAGI